MGHVSHSASAPPTKHNFSQTYIDLTILRMSENFSERQVVVGGLDAKERRTEERFGVQRNVRFVNIGRPSRPLQHWIGQCNEPTVLSEPPDVLPRPGLLK